jgi:hypothetical protein
MLFAAMVAAQVLQFNPWYPYVMPPPVRYDHATAKPWHIVSMPEPALDDRCHQKVLACTYRLNGCTTYIRPQLRHYELLLRHERAHCNGWPANHPL